MLLPEGAPDVDAPMGLRLGPPSLEALDLPEDVEVRLHNQLFARGLFTELDVKRRRLDIFGALQAALKVDVRRVAELYREEVSDEGGAGKVDKKKAKSKTKRR